MKDLDHSTLSHSPVGEKWSRLILIALATLILCSCRSLSQDETNTSLYSPPLSQPITQKNLSGRIQKNQTLQHQERNSQIALVNHFSSCCDGCSSEVQEFNRSPTLPREAWSGPMPVGDSWSPPGIKKPWPSDEYLHDGGDRNTGVLVGEDWRVHGLDTEDTIAHFDTLAGERIVESSNRVHIYAPRFAAVRKVSGVLQQEQSRKAGDLDQPVRLEAQTEHQVATTTLQPIQPEGQIGSRSVNTFRERLLGIGLENSQLLGSFHNKLFPYENLEVIKHGFLAQMDEPLLASGTAAAVSWSHDKSVQVVLDHITASVESTSRGTKNIFTFDSPHGENRLRLIKLASRKDALPGETVDFTLRFDNVGVETIGNVTIIDNLTTRLEYVPDSGQSTLKSEFFSKLNQGESLELRWEISEPLKPGQGGVIRFKCLVR